MAAPTIVQHNANQDPTGNGTTVTLTSNVTAGNMLLLFVSCNSGATINTPTMTGETFTSLAGATVTSSHGQIACYKTFSAAGGQKVVNFSYSVAGPGIGVHCHVFEINGQAASPVDATGTVADSSTVSVSTSSATTNATDLVIAYFYDDNGEGSFTAGSPYSAADQTQCADGNTGFGEDHATSSTGVQTATATNSLSTDTVSQAIVAIMPPSGGVSVAQTTPAFYFDYEHSSLKSTPWSEQQEVFSSDQQDVFNPIVPVATLAEILYEMEREHPNVSGPFVSFDHGYPDTDTGDYGAPPILNKGVVSSSQLYDEHLANPNIQGWVFASDDENDRSILIVLPPPAWDNDAENQLAQLPYVGIGTDQGQDWTQLIILPAPAWDNDAENQLSQLPYVGIVTDQGQDWIYDVIIPVNVWDNVDGEHQKAYLAYQGIDSDQGMDWAIQIILPPGWNPALGNTQDNDQEQQFSTDFNYNNIASDSGQDTTNFIILPLTGFDNDAENQKQWADWVSNIASDAGLDNTQFIILPLQNLDNDADLQKQWLDSYANIASDSGQDTTNFIILPILTYDNDAEQQNKWPDWVAQIASDAGQDWTQLIIIPPPPFDPSQLPQVEDQSPNIQQYNLLSDIEDSGWTCFVISGGQVTQVIHFLRRGIG